MRGARRLRQLLAAGGGLLADVRAAGGELLADVRAVPDLLTSAREARARSGKSVRAQAVEIVSLRRGRLRPGEYFEYRLYDDERFSSAQKREYVGRRFQWSAFAHVNDPGLVAKSGIAGSWYGMIDKGLLDLLFAAADLPRPHTVAVFDPAGPFHPGVPVLRTLDELEQLLRQGPPTGFFTKPVRAASGDDAYAVLSIDGDTALLANGERIPLAALLPAITVRGRTVVQERLLPHPLLAQAFGQTISTTRIFVLRDDDSFRIHRAICRIPAGSSMVDNFGKGTSSNSLAIVEPKSGRLLQAWQGIGLDQRRVTEHPDTGHPLEGSELPDWAEALTLVERGSRFFAGMALQSWDVALTNRGPVLIEVNDVSGVQLLQLCGPPGLLDRDLVAFLRARGFRWPYPRSTR